MSFKNIKSVKPDMLMSDLIIENPLFLLMMEHFDLDFVVHSKTVEEICTENDLSLNIFITVANLYQGLEYENTSYDAGNDIITLIKFLKNSHSFFKDEKYPEIRRLIELMYQNNTSPEIKLVEKFFDEYFQEVLKHLSYEEKTVFPYIMNLVENKNLSEKRFKIKTYGEKHTDIEYKLTELKNLLIKHIDLKNDKALRRKLLFSLFELENDLNIHTVAEIEILIPMIKIFEVK